LPFTNLDPKTPAAQAAGALVQVDVLKAGGGMGFPSADFAPAGNIGGFLKRSIRESGLRGLPAFTGCDILGVLMARRGNQGTEALRCSFCRKSQDSVLKLISSPVDGPMRPYICDECVAVCASILEDDREPSDAHLSAARADHPLTPQLMAAIERWIRQEMSGADSVQELAAVRALAIAIVGLEPMDSPPK
jgi:hypothetical protein